MKSKTVPSGVLERELLAGDRNITRNSGDEARTKRENDIKRRVGYGSKHGMAPDQLKLKTLNDNPYDRIDVQLLSIANDYDPGRTVDAKV